MPQRGDVARVRVPDHDRFIRCLKIVEHTYWSGSASVRELAKSVGRLLIATSGTVSTVRRDVARLQIQGLPIVLDPAGNCRVDAVLPGFALRLTKAEGSAVLTWCFRLGRASVSALPWETASEAVVPLITGLQRARVTGGDTMTVEAGPTLPGLGRAEATPNPLSVWTLRGEARVVARCLHIYDLVADRAARNIAELSAILDVSPRTVKYDLRIMRAAGLGVTFSRRRQEFRPDDLNGGFTRDLTRPKAAALLFLLTLVRETDAGVDPVLRHGADKLIRALHAAFGMELDNVVTPRPEVGWPQVQ
jgi:predicted DNA-binding transcriptional regulator YafY